MAERQFAVRRVMAYLVAGRAIGALDDVTVASASQLAGVGRRVHFREQVE